MTLTATGLKRTTAAVLLFAVLVPAGAQTMYDALNFSRNEYFGTARTMGMGNAVTAVGGDLGTIGINPAGSAVAGYSQFTITPGLTMSAATSSYSPYPTGGVDKYSNGQKTDYSRMALPNIGLTLDFSTGRKSGLKSVTYGVVINSTSHYTDKMMAGGVNDKSSYLSAMAVGADGCDIDVMNGYLDLSGREIDDWEYAYHNTNYPFNAIVNAQAGAIANYGNTEDSDYYTRYIAATEGYEWDAETGKYNIFQGGPLDQVYGRQIYGSKQDIVFNVGFNFSDKLYLGANLGSVSIDYNFDEYFKEAAKDPRDFPINLVDGAGQEYTINFNNYRARYSYSADGTGIYGKIGIIAKPFSGLRLGAAIQTPTYLSVEEVWQHAADIHYSDYRDDGSATSPKGNYSYNLRMPYRFNAGAAWTFGRFGMVSADYEMTDYSTMKFSEKRGEGFDSIFHDLNQDIRNCMGAGHQLRLGAEVKPFEGFSIRAGYNLTSTSEFYGTEKLTDRMSAYSLGAGYSTVGSFFMDIAARFSTLADEYISPYADYLDDCPSPMILNKRNRLAVAATIGWRF